MQLFFQDLPSPESANPHNDRLIIFINELRRWLAFLVEDRDATPLWRRATQLRTLAIEAFSELRGHFESLIARIGRLTDGELASHGLTGASLSFKLEAVRAAFRDWTRSPRRFTLRGGFRRVVDAVDAILDSILDVAGVGGAIKEFKDILLAIAPETTKADPGSQPA